MKRSGKRSRRPQDGTPRDKTKGGIGGKSFDHVFAFENRAGLHEARASDCDHCALPLVFALETARGDAFSLDLVTLLKCLKEAEHNAAIPPIDPAWWLTIARAYNV